MVQAITRGWQAVIVTALPVEYKAVQAHLSSLYEQVHPAGTVYEQGTYAGKNVVWNVSIVEIGMGNPKAAQETERAIEYFKPGLILFVGVAGGLKDVRCGDVVVATKVYGYEAGKVGKSFETRPEVGRSTHLMEQRARAEAHKTDWLTRFQGSAPDPVPQVLVAPIAAGEKVVASKLAQTYKFLRTHYGDAVAVEMEGHGFITATHANHHVEALIIRGISDLIDGKSEADAAHGQERAAQAASAFAFEVLAKLGDKDMYPFFGKEPASAGADRKPSSSRTITNTFHGPVGQIFQGDHHQISIDNGSVKSPRDRD